MQLWDILVSHVYFYVLNSTRNSCFLGKKPGEGLWLSQVGYPRFQVLHTKKYFVESKMKLIKR